MWNPTSSKKFPSSFTYKMWVWTVSLLKGNLCLSWVFLLQCHQFLSHCIFYAAIMDPRRQEMLMCACWVLEYKYWLPLFPSSHRNIQLQEGILHRDRMHRILSSFNSAIKYADCRVFSFMQQKFYKNQKDVFCWDVTENETLAWLSQNI